MAVNIVFETDSVEFKENGMSEIFKVLNEVQAALLRGDETGKVYDDDMNVIGNWEVSLPKTI